MSHHSPLSCTLRFLTRIRAASSAYPSRHSTLSAQVGRKPRSGRSQDTRSPWRKAGEERRKAAALSRPTSLSLREPLSRAGLSASAGGMDCPPAPPNLFCAPRLWTRIRGHSDNQRGQKGCPTPRPPPQASACCGSPFYCPRYWLYPSRESSYLVSQISPNTLSTRPVSGRLNAYAFRELSGRSAPTILAT